jgi:hypothetical protein
MDGCEKIAFRISRGNQDDAGKITAAASRISRDACGVDDHGVTADEEIGTDRCYSAVRNDTVEMS